jgi:hypothetical protein
MSDVPAARPPRLCVSVPVHEEPAVILDQVENYRAYLGADTQVVLHLSQSMGLDPAAVQPLLPDGVYTNPVSHPTQWGDLAHLHVSNLEFAYKNLDPFDYVLLQASNDLYVRPGAPERIAETRAGFIAQHVTEKTTWVQGPPALRDRQLAAMLADVGTEEIWGGQVEGSYYAADLFREMLDVIGRHLDIRADREVYNREEILFPALATHLLDGAPKGHNLIYVDVLTRGPAISPAVVHAVLDGTLAGAWTGSDSYGVKRVARTINDLNRTLIRGMARTVAGGRRLEPPRTFSGRGFVALAFAVDVLARPGIVRAWQDAFGPDDDATLAILLDEADAFATPQLLQTLENEGTSGPDAADVVLVTARAGSFEEASLRWTTHAVIRPAGAEIPPLFDDRPVFPPDRVDELRFMVARRLGQPRPDVRV